MAAATGGLWISLPFLLEAGYSARDLPEHDALFAELRALPWAPIDEPVEARAAEAQRQLARLGHHRRPPVDLIIAALAERHDLGVLHYDRDYERIAMLTDLTFASEWLAQPGALS